MRNAGGTVGAILIAVLAAICCAGLPLIAAVGTGALAVWLSYSGYMLIAIVIVAAALAIFWLQRRRTGVHDRQPEAFNKASRHE